MRKLRFRGTISIICGWCRERFQCQQATGRPREFCDDAYCKTVRQRHAEAARPFRVRGAEAMRASRLRRREAINAHPA